MFEITGYCDHWSVALTLRGTTSWAYRSKLASYLRSPQWVRGWAPSATNRSRPH